MNNSVNHFSRIIAGLLIITVSFMTFSCPDGGTSPYVGPSPLTPGVGTPSYFYIDADGNAIETEASGSGRTGLVVKDNEFAEGVLVYSDDTGTEDKVAFVYEDNIVSMFFKKGSNFPHRMIISDGSDYYYAYVSSYDTGNHTYNITFMHDFTYDMMDHIVLNENIFTLYKDDTNLSSSQNRRMANMTIAMGIWGSLYATFDQRMNPPYIVFNRSARGIFSNFFKGVAKVFTVVAFVAVVVAVVVVPVVSLISPAAGLVIANLAWWAAEKSILVTAVATGLELVFELIEKDEKSGPTTATIPIINVTLPYENNRNIKYNSYGNYEEFHIPPDSELAVQFYCPGTDFSKISLDNIMFIDEPSVPTGDNSANLGHFKKPTLEILSSTEFIVKFRRTTLTGCNGDGKVNFGFVFNLVDKDGNPLDLTVNGYSGGFDFRLPPDFEKKLYKNMIVIYFCVKED